MTLEENIRAILECNFTGYKDDIIDTATKNIMSLSDIENRKTGHWIETDMDIYECSECHKGLALLEKENYCPHCGAKMDKENKE